MYPEHEKLTKVKEQAEIIGDFLSFCFLEKDYVLCEYEYEEYYDAFYPVRKTTKAILYEYFGIDPDKIQDEKQQMIDRLREMNS